MLFEFPKSQRELLIAARGTLSQAKFAAQLGVDRSCLSRYEREELGAPTSVLNYCLAHVARVHAQGHSDSLVRQALAHLQCATRALEDLGENEMFASEAGPPCPSSDRSR